MSSLAPLLEGFFTERLLHQRQASPHTVAAYRDTFGCCSASCIDVSAGLKLVHLGGGHLAHSRRVGPPV
jgi:hypothetical protein